MKTKWIVGIMMTLFCVWVTGCGANLNRINRQAFTENGMADECFNQIIEAIKAQDAEALLALFSDEAKAELDKELFEQKAAELFSLYDGEVKTYHRDLATSQTSSTNSHTHETVGYYDIEAENAVHHLLFINQDWNRENKDTEDISVIVYISDELYNTEGFMWKGKSRAPGIYVDLEMKDILD